MADTEHRPDDALTTLIDQRALDAAAGVERFSRSMVPVLPATPLVLVAARELTLLRELARRTGVPVGHRSVLRVLARPAAKRELAQGPAASLFSFVAPWGFAATVLGGIAVPRCLALVPGAHAFGCRVAFVGHTAAALAAARGDLDDDAVAARLVATRARIEPVFRRHFFAPC